MKDKKLLYIMILLLFLFTIGLAYAYFMVTITGEANDIKVSTSSLVLNYQDGPAITLSDVFPGDTLTKEIAVENVGSESVYYAINMIDVINGFTNNELVISLSCVSYSSYEVSGTSNTVSGTCRSVNNKVIPSANFTILNNILIDPGIIQVYQVTILFIETSSVQNYNQGAAFSGKIDIKESTELVPDLTLSSLTVNGVASTTVPSTGTYYLTNSSSCTGDSSISWNNDTKRIKVSNYSTGDTCSVDLKSQPLLSEVPLGSYVTYTGTNGCPTTEVTGTSAAQSSNACSGKNANQNADTTNYTYGYCSSSSYKFYTYGWRLAYVDNSEPYIVSAGSPQCIVGTSSDSTTTIANLNTAALTYCNPNYAYGSSCSSTNSYALKSSDFEKISNQWFGTTKTLSSCSWSYSTKECGYNNDIIDNGGYYWFGEAFSASSTFFWIANYRIVINYSSTDAYGVRPVLHLKSTIYVTGGSGTMENPYTIAY